MRTLILLAASSALFAASLPAWACGMPPMEDMVLADAMGGIDQLLGQVEDAPDTPQPPGLETLETAPQVPTPEATDAPAVPETPAPLTATADPQS